MILLLTNAHDRHTDMVIAELEKRDSPYIRFNTEEFPLSSSLVVTPQGDRLLSLGDCEGFALDEVKSIWYRRPLKPTIDPAVTTPSLRSFAEEESEAGLYGALYTLRCFWVSHPLRIRDANFKVPQLYLAQSLGFLIPRTVVTNVPEKVKEFFEACNGRVVAKTVSRNVVADAHGLQAIFTTPLTARHLEHLKLVRYAPCIFQEYVPKRVELRVTVVGRQVFAAEIHSQKSDRARDDWRHYDFANTPHQPHQLPEEIENLCVQLVKVIGLAFGAIDMILTPDGRYVFLEINPNGQWGWIQQLTGLPIAASIAELLIRAGV